MDSKTTAIVVIAIIAVASVAGVGIFLMTSTTPPVEEKKTLSVALYSAPPTLDAPGWTGTDLMSIGALLYDRLVEFNNQSQLVPGLAKSWVGSPDGLTWTFYLRSGVKFHDGTDFNAAAVKYNFDRILREKFAASYRLYQQINQTIVVNATVVQFKLNSPYTPLLTNLAYVTGGISSPAALQAHPGNYSYYVSGTGPYKRRNYIPSAQVVVVANEEYWGQKPKLGKIEILFVSDANTRTIALQRGDVQASMMIPLTNYASLINRPNMSSYVLYQRMIFYAINYTMFPKNVRLAMNYAIDKTAIINGLFKGNAEIEKTPIPPTVLYAIDSLTPYAYNPTLARQLLAAAGYPNGLNVTIETTSGTYVYDKEVTEIVQSQLAAVGITAKIVINDYGAHYTTRLRNANPIPPVQLAIIGWGVSTGDPDYFLKSLFYGPLQHGGSYNQDYKNSTVDALTDLAAKETNLATRAQQYAQIQTMIWQDVPAIFLYTQPEIFVWNSNVHGVEIMPTGALNLRNAYIT